MNNQTDDQPFYVADARDHRNFKPFVKYFKNCRNALEIAAGQGFFLDQVKKAGGVMAGVEIDPELCAQIKQRGLTVHQQNFFDFLESSPADHFDGCMAAHIIEHLTPPDATRLLTLLHRSMKAGAPLVIITPNIANLRKAVGDFWRDPTHVRPYPVQALEKLFKMTGWKLVESGEHSDRKPPTTLQIRYALRNALFGKYWVGEAVFAVAEKR
jgi:SAM-dependent methyltransferase